VSTFYQLDREDRRIVDARWRPETAPRYILVHRNHIAVDPDDLLCVSCATLEPWDLEKYHDAIQFTVCSPSEDQDIYDQVQILNRIRLHEMGRCGFAGPIV